MGSEQLQADKSKGTTQTGPRGQEQNQDHCEGCGIPRHKREQCQLSDHLDFNKKDLWINSSAFAVIKVRQEAKGDQNKHPKLKWSEYASGGTISNARFPEKNRMDR